MKGRMDTDLGEVIINPDVIATYAGGVAVECFGIVGMAGLNLKDGVIKVLRRDFLRRGINVTINQNRISLDFHVIMAYGVSIQAVVENLISNVRYKLEEFTGMELERIRVYVEGVRVID
ncbi:MAG: Asp23/Gls24 family envelope stress response protein [Eubacterium sp.]|nr:Asp23/Gls24 family envelope stress response protein [Eubacterium sp.]